MKYVSSATEDKVASLLFLPSYAPHTGWSLKTLKFSIQTLTLISFTSSPAIRFLTPPPPQYECSHICIHSHHYCMRKTMLCPKSVNSCAMSFPQQQYGSRHQNACRWDGWGRGGECLHRQFELY